MLRTGFVVLITLLTAPAFGQLKPSPRLPDLNVFAGTWTCKGKAFASAWGAEHFTTATIKVRWVLGGFWLHAEYAEKKSPQNPNPAAGHVYWGWDERKKKLVGYGVNNFGGHVPVESDGWSGDTIVWSGTMSVGGMTVSTRDTFVRKSARVVDHKTEAEKNGQWVELNAETCRKSS